MNNNRALCSLAASLFFSTHAMHNPQRQQQPWPSQKYLVKTVKQTKPQIIQAKFSPDGKYFLENVASGDYQITLWSSNPADRKIIATFDGWYNRLKFSPDSTALILYNQSRLGHNEGSVILYSLEHKKRTQLSNDAVHKNVKLATSSNGRYIMYRYVLNPQGQATHLFEYNKNTGSIDEISLKNWHMDNVWTFASDNQDFSADQHIIYISKDKDETKVPTISQNLTVRTIKGNVCIMYPINEAYAKIKAHNSLITALHDNHQQISLFKIEDNEIKKIRIITNIPSLYTMKILTIPQRNIIIHQVDQSAFIVLDDTYETIGSYTWQNNVIPPLESDQPVNSYKPWLTKLVADETGNNLVAQYDGNQEATPSSLVFFDLSSIRHGMEGRRKCFTQKILSIQMLYNNFIVQGRKAYVFDAQGNKVGHLGECQETAIHKNSLVQIHQTNSIAYNSKLGGYLKIPVKIKVWQSFYESNPS